MQGQSTTYTVTVQSVSGFSGPVTLNVKSLPGNIVGCTAFSPATVTVPANGSVNSTLTLCTTSQSPLGAFSNLYVEGQGGGLTRNSLTFGVTITSPGDFAVSVSPTSRTVVQGQSTTYTVTVQSVSGFSGPVTLNVKSLPGNIVGCTAFSPATVTVPANGSVNSTLTLCTTSQSPLGTFSNLYVEGQGEADEELVDLRRGDNESWGFRGERESDESDGSARTVDDLHGDGAERERIQRVSDAECEEPALGT
ncbi:MAG: hypothetical protein IPG76_00065 [Acidobacteria bacterium]|nr:hypothetical protein [Acidobacteriota bacterium]